MGWIVKKYSLADILMIGFCGGILLAEVLHLLLLFQGWSIQESAYVFAVCLCLLVVGTVLLCVLKKKSNRDDVVQPRVEVTSKNRTFKIFYGVFATLVILQGLLVLFGNHIYLRGDMTVENVASFLHYDGVYRVNPMTGAPYTQGMPLRLQILGLPTLYSFVCTLTGLSPALVVWRLVPVVVLFFSYMAYGALAKALFTESKEKRIVFLLVVATLIWVETGIGGMDGYHALYGAWRGTALRNLVLIPWMFSLMLCKKRVLALGVIATEACLCWTLYGAGVCALIFVLMQVAEWILAVGRKTPKAAGERRSVKNGAS